jgi:hypothetical protein
MSPGHDLASPCLHCFIARDASAFGRAHQTPGLDDLRLHRRRMGNTRLRAGGEIRCLTLGWFVKQVSRSTRSGNKGSWGGSRVNECFGRSRAQLPGLLGKYNVWPA